ncbi:dihydrolipoyl dehydrogenase [Nitrosomonas sp. Nm58]|uniref:dihydrolipoyl dehydrogenase n=1 Tax=Nitrosomonas sp. Nm58 TaxID=200126 RepID=UPI00089AD8E4|nr:dihydrolipoyl dehydrogenase [Nitrosomonas sp. Nm58]SDZ03091.1 dihydrolipoamide dehydrogenase [Nitrosomonas sp. Nm58]
MANLIKVEVPDIGDFKDVSVIEVLVKPGDKVEQETSLIALETDKASIEVPSPQAGIIKEMHVKVGDKVSQGSLIVTLEAITSSTEATITQTSVIDDTTISDLSESQSVMTTRDSLHAEVVVLGAGPGGYTAAFRAADLGKQVVLIERYSTLGGVCLNVGCIPSKALLHVAKVITEAKEIEQQGVVFGKPKVAIGELRAWKESVVGKLTKGLTALAKQRKVEIIRGIGKFVSPHMIEVNTEEGITTVSFDHCIIAAGSSAARIPGFPYDDPRMMDSTDALKLADVPKKMLVIGGGIIGLEMATVYDALGSQISIVEQMNQLIPGADSDLVKPLYKHLLKRYEAIYLNNKVSKIEGEKKGLKVFFEGDHAPEPQLYDCILVAVGRRPNGKMIGAENANIQVNERGFIPVDMQMRTNIPHIFAIGDIAGEPMLAHKATYEGKLAAEVIAGHKVAFDARTIPSVAYTDPEIAWMGLTETDAKKQGIDYEKAVFPWAASGRAIAMGREEGFTKLLLDKNSRRILGAGIAGAHAGELIAEAVLALEMGADMQDISLVIHPHPTLSETILFSAEMAEGTITDLYMPKR